MAAVSALNLPALLKRLSSARRMFASPSPIRPALTLIRPADASMLSDARSNSSAGGPLRHCEIKGIVCL
jgi:hypothetical protein